MEKFFISRPIFAISLAIVIVLVGLISILNLPIEQYPDITPPVVEVSATYDGADAETVNNAVATPVAQSVMGVSDMLYLQTTSANDGSMVMQVTFDIGSDPDLDAIFTQNNVSSAAAQLPATVTKQGVTTRKTMTGFLLVFSLHSDGRYDDEFLSNYAYINLQNELLKIDGVGKVSIMGAGEYAMRVWLRPDVLKYYGIPVSAVTAAIENQGGIYPAGQFGAEPAPDGTSYTYTVTMPPQITTAEQFGDIVVVTTSEGEQIRLRDVADVSLGSQSYGVSSLFEGKPTALIVIYQEPGSNAVAVGDKVKAEMARLGERLPGGITTSTVVDTTTSIDAGISDIFTTLIIALVLVICIIYLFIQDWRATVIPLVAIPVSLVGAFALFPLLGFSINIISLLGLVLAIGLVVDDAIVVVEAAQVNIANGMNPRAAALEAMKNVASPIVATTVVLLAVFIPVSFTGGITGRLFQQFSVTIAVSVVISAFNALTLSPALCALLLRRREPPKKGFFAAFNRWFARRMDKYTAFTPTLIRHVARTGVFIAAVLAVIFLVWRKLPAGFLPEEDQGYVMVMVSTPEASSLQVTQKAMIRADEVIRTLPEVASTSFAAGFNMMAGIASTDSGIIFVSLVGYSDRKLTAMEIAQRLTDELYMAVPGAECFAFIPPSIPGLGITSGVSVEVQDLEGRGTAYLLEQSERLMDSLRKLPSVASVTTQFNAGVPQRRLRIDKEQALASGVDLGVLYGDLTTLLGGAYVNNFSRFGKLYQTYIQAAPAYRMDKRSLDSYYVASSSGESVPVSSLVEVVDTVGVEYVSQFNLYRSIGLTVTPAARTSTTTVMQDITRTAAQVLPDDVGTAWSGTSFQEANASKTGGLVYLLALVFVFLALAALYESWGLPLAILMSVPVAVLGAVLFIGVSHLLNAFYVNDIYMQISLVMLIGLAAKNAILVVEYADRLFNEQGASLMDAAIGAAKLRVRPIIMTAFAFILGVMPLIFASGVYATARNIMGVALVGGMLFATLLGIFVYVRRRAVALVGGGALRAAAQRQTRRKSPDSLVGVGAAGRTAGAGGRSRHDLFHPARIRTRSGDRPAELRPAARIGGPDRLDVPLRHVGRRGAGAGPESGLHRRSGHSAVPAGRGADAAVTRHPAGRNAAANGQRGGWTASADRLPSGGHSRRTALGAARTAARHHAGALRHARRSRRSGRCPRQPVPVHCSDGQRRSRLQFDQRFNFGQPLGVGCARLADAPRLQFRQTSPRGTGRHGALHAVGADLRADRADGLFRRRAGAGGHHHLPQTDRTLRRAGPRQRPHRRDDAGALPQRPVRLPRRDRRPAQPLSVADGVREPSSAAIYQLRQSLQGAGRRVVRRIYPQMGIAHPGVKSYLWSQKPKSDNASIRT